MRRLRSSARRKNAVEQQLDAIRIFTAELELHGYVAPTGQRVTDILLRGDDLAFLPAGAEVVPENWMRVSPSDILVVIPPPLPATARWMDEIERIDFFVQVGPYQVTGTAHLRQGDVPNEQFRRRQPFLPLTRATISRDGENEQVDVAIVNLGASTRFGPAA
jgi:hypothetical protein